MADATPGISKYEQLVSLIEETEQSAPRHEVGSIDITETFADESKAQASSYADLVVIIDEIEGGRKINKAAPVHPSAQVQQPQAPQAQAPQPVMEEPQVPQPAEAKKEAAGKELGSVAKRLGSLMPSFKPMGRKHINVKDLVLPNLSTSDQISELERIIEGVREGVFDPEHIGIVLQEVYGLDQFVAQEKKTNKKKKQQLNELDQSLVDMRDQRLAEAVSLLDKTGA